MYRLSAGIEKDPVKRRALADRVFFTCGACHILAYAFLERYPRGWRGWRAELIELPIDVLVSEATPRQHDGLWLREPRQFFHDARPRAPQFPDRFPAPA